MLDNFGIRKACEDDYPDVSRLFQESDNWHFRHEPYVYRETSESHRSSEYFKSLLGESWRFTVATVDDAIAGFLLGYCENKGFFPFHAKRRSFIIDNIVVSEGLRGKGIGKRLMSELLEWARAEGLNDVMLNVYAFNDEAIGLYESLGFKELSRDMIVKL